MKLLHAAAFLFAAALGSLVSGAAQAATLYISEFANGVSTIASQEAQIFPQPAITDQTVAITASSVQSAAFNSKTHAIMVECDADCSIAIGSNPTATTSNFLMGDGLPYFFAVGPGQKIAVISNTSGGSGSDVNIVSVGGTAVTSPLPVSPSPSSGTAAGITPVVSATLESNHVLDASPGNLYWLNVTSGATAGYLMTFNATSAPGDGAVTPIDCVQVPINSTVSLATAGAPPETFATGITAVFSSTGCFTKTASATAFFNGGVK